MNTRLIQALAKQSVCSKSQPQRGCCKQIEFLSSYAIMCSGFTSRIDALKDWIQLITVTGIVHGSTFSKTTLVSSPTQTSSVGETFKQPLGKLQMWVSNLSSLRQFMSCPHRKKQWALNTTKSFSFIGSSWYLYSETKRVQAKLTRRTTLWKTPLSSTTYDSILSDFFPGGFDGSSQSCYYQHLERSLALSRDNVQQLLNVNIEWQKRVKITRSSSSGNNYLSFFSSARSSCPPLP